MKKSIMLLAMIASVSCLSAQSIERYVIDYTIGELVITTANSAAGILTQGFQQPFSNSVVAVAENSDDPLCAEMFPNPFTDEFNILISNGKEDNYKVMVFDIIGQQVLEATSSSGFDGKKRIRYSTKNLATGSYFVRVMHNQEVLLTRKVMKVNL
jgi:hypothetical protein